MSKAKTQQLLGQLAVGLHTDSADRQALVQDLNLALRSARHFSGKLGASEARNPNWHSQWDNIEEILRRIKVLVDQMDGAMASTGSDRFSKALEAWEAFQAEDAKLSEALNSIRTETNVLSAAVRNDWNALAFRLESHLETIHACAQALRIKAELLKKYSQAEVDCLFHLFENLLSQLPNPQVDVVDARSYEREYHQAVAELGREHHQFLGFMDVVKALLMLVETPEARIRKRGSLKVEAA